MNTLRMVLPITVCLLLLTIAFPASGQSGIVVSGADALQVLDFESSSALRDLLDDVPEQVIAQYSNSMLHLAVAPPPGALASLLAIVPEQVIFQYPNSNLKAVLVYPRELLNDTVAPVSSSIEVNFDATLAQITWMTNEFARCTLHYGTQPGNYTEEVEAPFYEKQHSMLLNGLTLGTLYYAQLVCTDQSENSAESAEFVIQQQEDPKDSMSLPLLYK